MNQSHMPRICIEQVSGRPIARKVIPEVRKIREVEVARRASKTDSARYGEIKTRTASVDTLTWREVSLFVNPAASDARNVTGNI